MIRLLPYFFQLLSTEFGLTTLLQYSKCSAWKMVTSGGQLEKQFFWSSFRSLADMINGWIYCFMHLQSMLRPPEVQALSKLNFVISVDSTLCVVWSTQPIRMQVSAICDFANACKVQCPAPIRNHIPRDFCIPMPVDSCHRPRCLEHAISSSSDLIASHNHIVQGS